MINFQFKRSKNRSDISIANVMPITEKKNINNIAIYILSFIEPTIV